MMTKKDFSAIAEVIARVENQTLRAALAWNLAEVLQKSNPAFNLRKFIEACGVCAEDARKKPTKC